MWHDLIPHLTSLCRLMGHYLQPIARLDHF
jgi:hypothetical protein